jgi:hypothetical protein
MALVCKAPEFGCLLHNWNFIFVCSIGNRRVILNLKKNGEKLSILKGRRRRKKKKEDS